MKYVFGPVPSRRLGRSLGIDLIPFKACTFDCLYCQLGPTPAKTTDLQDTISIDGVIEELKEKLTSRPDYITLSGSGEPTLYVRMGELIERIHSLTDTPVAVITNGSLLWNKEVRQGLVNADVVLPSLDAGDDETFRLINRPHEDVSFAQLLLGLITFREEYHGQYWLEVLLLSGLTDTREKVSKIAEAVKRIRPDRVQLNTCVRPGADPSARMVSRDKLLQLAELFSPKAEVIADYRDEATPRGESEVGKTEILEMLARHPSTAEDVATALTMGQEEAMTALEGLVAEGLVKRSEVGRGRAHYVVAKRQ
jgi:wyosine [tRNA(Phe)-imidazoG37] synthetase (radical SAM superfamily)